MAGQGACRLRGNWRFNLVLGVFFWGGNGVVFFRANRANRDDDGGLLLPLTGVAR